MENSSDYYIFNLSFNRHSANAEATSNVKVEGSGTGAGSHADEPFARAWKETATRKMATEIVIDLFMPRLTV